MLQPIPAFNTGKKVLEKKDLAYFQVHRPEIEPAELVIELAKFYFLSNPCYPNLLLLM